MAIFAAAKAVGRVTRAATTDLLADGDTITLGAVTYTFKTTTTTADDIFLSGSSSAATIAAFNSLAAVVNGTGVLSAAGADGFTGSTSPHPSMKAGTMVSLTQDFTALMPGVSGNELAFSEVIVDAQITLNGSGFLGATTAGAGSAHADLRAWIDLVQASMQINSQVQETLLRLEAELT